MSATRQLLPDVAVTSLDMLVQVDVMWVAWGPLISEPDVGQPWRRFDRFVHRVLGAEPSEDPDAPASIDGWLMRDPEPRPLTGLLRDLVGPVGGHAREFVEQVAARPRPEWPAAEARCGPSTRNGPTEQRWLSGAAGSAALAEMVRDLRCVNRLVDMQDSAAHNRLAPLLNLQACRIHLAGDQVHRLAPTRPRGSLPPHACLDLRFRAHIGRYWLYATLSLWTRRPISRSHGPRGPGFEIATPFDVPHAPDALRAVRSCLYEQLKSEFTPLRPTVFDRCYYPPRFWIATGRDLPATDPAGESRSLDTITRATLGAAEARSLTVAQGVVSGEDGVRLRVLRRFVPVPGAPRYLIIPDRSPSPELQENAVRNFVYRMTSDEADASATLFDISSDADIAATLINSYQQVADRGNTLWDELSMQFPTARGRQLNRAHEQAELIHQVLLQGIADLELVHTETHELSSKITETTDRLVDSFDAEFTERAVPDCESIRESVRCGGYVALTDRFVGETCTAAGRARDTYRGLLDGVTLAFDERRVRMTDKVAVLALAAATLLALLPFVTEIWSAYLGRVTWIDAFPNLLVSSVSGLLAAGALAFWYFRSHFGALRVSRAFRPRYESLRDYLTDCRTDRLIQSWHAWRAGVDRLVDDPGRRVGPEYAAFYRRWDGEDVRLAQRCAEQLDALATTPARVEEQRRERLRRSGFPVGPGPSQAHRLRDAVEQWALVSLFATERPRKFYRFPLPRLTLLYCAYPVWSLLPETTDSREPPLVAPADLLLELRIQCRAYPDEIGDVRRWTEALAEQARRHRLTARDVLARITDTGVQAGMTRQQWEDVLRRMRADTPNVPC